MNSSIFGEFILAKKELVSFMALTTFFVIRGIKFSPLIFLFFCVVIFSKSLAAFALNFNKIILGLGFVYSIVSYNLYLFLKLELEEPFYNPEYPSNILSSFENKLLPIKLKFSSRLYRAFLTNWGKEGFFCKVDGLKSVPRGKINIEIEWKGHTFRATGVAVTIGRGGVGVKNNKECHNGVRLVRFLWYHFRTRLKAKLSRNLRRCPDDEIFIANIILFCLFMHKKLYT